MIARYVLPALFAAILSPSLLRAQAQPKNFDPFNPDSAGSTSHAKMYEDIEIFRRILDRKLHPLYLRTSYPSMGMMGNGMGMMGGGGMRGTGGNPMMALNFSPTEMAYMQGGTMMAVWQEVVSPSLEGVYLKGQGVVYTATLSSLLQPKSTAEAETPKPVSEWESVRRQLRNEKEEPKKPEASKPPKLSDVLLKVLAENGHHFSQLGDNESLTLVLTVRESNPPSPARHTAGSSGAAKPRTDSPEPPSVSSKVRDLELLGDLHMKQEHYGMAREAFRDAMALKPGPEQTAVLARKLAQAFLYLGEIENARKAVDQAIAFKEGAGDAKDKPAPTAKPALPVKLIISVQKKWLDQVKEGKITFEEFRRWTRVETLRFDESRSHK